MNKIPKWISEYKCYAEIEYRTKLKIGSLLGFGAYGAVFSTDDPSLVIKLTSDQNELILASKVTNIRRADTKLGLGPSDYLDGLVFIFGIFNVPPAYVEKFGEIVNICAIVREVVLPIKQYPGKIPNIKNIHRILEKLHHEAAVFHRKRGSVNTEEDIVDYVSALQELEPYSVTLYTTLLELVNNGIVMKDTHVGNIGVSLIDWGPDYRQPEELVIFDLGFTPTSCDYDIDVKVG